MWKFTVQSLRKGQPKDFETDSEGENAWHDSEHYRRRSCVSSFVQFRERIVRGACGVECGPRRNWGRFRILADLANLRTFAKCYQTSIVGNF